MEKELLSAYTHPFSFADMFNFANVPEMIMRQVEYFANYIHFPDTESEKAYDKFIVLQPGLCNLQHSIRSAIMNQSVDILSKDKLIPGKAYTHTLSHTTLFNGCKITEPDESKGKSGYCFKEDYDSSGPINTPCDICPVALAAYYVYLKETNPEEFKRQREEYYKNKDEVDGTILNTFHLVGTGKAPVPTLTSKRIQELRDLIDSGYIYLTETDSITLGNFDTEEKDWFEDYRPSQMLNLKTSSSKALISYVKNISLHEFYKLNDMSAETLYQVLFILSLLRDNQYNDYVKAVKEKEEKIKKLPGTYFRGYVAGSDKKRIDEALASLDFKIRYSYNLKSSGYELTSALNFATTLSNKEDGIFVTTLKPVPNDFVYVLNGLSDFIQVYRTKEKDINIDLVMKHFISELSSLETNKHFILTGTETEINEFLRLDPKLKLLFKQNAIEVENLSAEDILKQISLLNPTQPITENSKNAIIDIIDHNTGALPFDNIEASHFINNHISPSGELIFGDNTVTLKSKDFTNEINKLTGLCDIKESLNDFYNLVNFKQLATQKGLNLETTNMHMIFDGPPGTGKTTVARIIAKALYDIGFTKSNKIVECERKDLVAEYVGQTAIKTDKKIQEARGGVLFIDEAYSLAAGERDFGHEAIATLIKAMEDYKDDLIVILAGYSKEMQSFVDANSGIKSRIGYNFHFKDYSETELTEMLINKLLQSGFEVSDECSAPIRELIKNYINEENFGNGRFVMKLYQSILQQLANRISSDSSVVFTKITPEDIPTTETIQKVLPKKTKSKLGFGE